MGSTGAMKTRSSRTLISLMPISLMLSVALCVFLPALLNGQAPAEPPPPPNTPAPPEALIGTWILNRNQSDDPEDKMRGHDDDDISLSGINSTVPNVATGGGSGRGGRTSQGQQRTSGAGPLGGPVGSVNPTDKDHEKTLELLRPSASLTMEEKPNEFDLTDSQDRKTVFFTDGRKLKKSKDENYQEIAAQWSAGRLVSDETAPRNAKLSHTFELSRDGRQLVETVTLDNSKIFAPIVIRYVYDQAPQPKRP
jgi:hypothetical protein